ncbi:MAG: mannonate dehydratase [Thermoanaerobaculia bacterium]
MTFRWFGPSDPVSLRDIRQIPGVTGIVSALYDVAPGDAWSSQSVEEMAESVDSHGMHLAVIESIPVHEDIKLGRLSRQALADNYAESLRVVGEAGIPVVCYNFMPVFDWTRTDIEVVLPDGSTALAFDDDDLGGIDLAGGSGELPGWAACYTRNELDELMAAYRQLDDAQLWDNLAWFLECVVPAAESAGVKLALHPDDPPWSIFGLPRIITDARAIDRVLDLVDSPCNGITLCTGSLGARADNDIPAIVRQVGARKRIHFAHCRNIKRTGEHKFNEVAHPTSEGDIDMFTVLTALDEVGFDGPMRSDHGRMIWGETGRPGYGLHDRALGATYLHGLWEGISKSKCASGVGK